MSPDDEAREDARRRFADEVRAAIWRAAAGVFGAVASREPIEGYRVLTAAVLDDPLCGVRAALMAHRVAAGLMREWAETARAAGASWDDVAAALDLTGNEHGYESAGAVAFRWLVERRDPAADRDLFAGRWTPAARWTCGACGERISDRGPFEPHPDDNEAGHHYTCARQTAAVRAYETERGEH